MLNPLQLPLQPVLREDPGTIVWRGLAHVIRNTLPFDVDPSVALLNPDDRAHHRVRAVEIPIGDHTTPGHLFTPKTPTGRTVLLAHGTTAEKIVPYSFFIRALLRHGIQVMTFEMDGHGRNPRPLCPTGLAENVPAALKFLLEQPEVDEDRVGMMGVSLGGACVLNAAGRLPGIKALATISTPHWVNMDDWDKLLEAFGTLNPEMLSACFQATPNRMLEFLSVPMRVAQSLDHPYEELELLNPSVIPAINRVLRHLDPLGNAGKLDETPLLVVNGDWDNITPPWQARDIYAHAAGPKALAMVPRRNHFTIMMSPQAVRSTVDWFRRWL